MPAEQEWLRLKPDIRRRYIVDEIPLKQLVEEVRNRGLSVTKSQLEYKLKQWKFRRNVDKETWRSIDRRITKRKAEGKDSQVIFCGKRLKMSTVENETDRNRDNTIFARLAPARSPSPMADAQVVVHTPQLLPTELLWPSSLPWFKFQDTYFQLMTNAAETGRRESGGSSLQPRTPLTSDLSTIIAPKQQLQSTSTQTLLPQIATTFGASMPESYPGEHFQRAHVLIDGSEQDKNRESLATLIYKVSNNMIDLFNVEQWKATTDLLNHCGIPSHRGGFSGIQDQTIRAFMDNLFAGAMQWEDVNILRWLLQSGRSPNAAMVRYGEIMTPLQAATMIGRLEVIDELFAAGANPNLVFSGESPLRIAICRDRYDILEHLLRRGASGNLDGAIMGAARRGLWSLLEGIVQSGGNLFETARPLSPIALIYSESVLSVAAQAGEHETRLVLDLLRSYHPSGSVTRFITADVLVAAAAEGRADTIRALSRVPGISSACFNANECGVTLQAAASKGHTSTCQLLLELYDSPNLDMGNASPMHLAAYGGHIGVLQLLIDHGANVNTVSDISRKPGQYLPPQIRTIVCSPQQRSCMTLLQILREIVESEPQTSSNLISGRCECATTLIQAGARISGQEVLTAVRVGHVGLLSAALDAASRSNASISEDVKNDALRIALRRGYHNFNFDIVKLLSAAGASAPRGEVIALIRRGRWNIAKLLLDNGSSLMEAGQSGMTALEAAILSQDQLIINKVLEALPDHYDAGSLCAAVAANQGALIGQLLNNRLARAQPDILETTAIGIAASTGALEILQMLLEHLPQSDVALIQRSPFSSFLESQKLGRGFWRGGCSKGSLLTMVVLGGCQSSEAFEILLKRGSQPDRKTWTAIGNTGSLDLAKILVSHIKRVYESEYPAEWLKPSQTILAAAIKKGDEALVRLLLEAGAEINEPDADTPSWYTDWPLQAAVQSQNLPILEALLKAGADANGNRGRPLEAAVQSQTLPILEALLKAGADANGNGGLPLEAAVLRQNLPVLEALLKAGADANGNGGRPLHAAVLRQNLPILEALLKAGADANGYGGLPLDAAVQSQNLPILEALLKAGADANGNGGRPLHAAAQSQNLPILEVLLKAGADVNKYDLISRFSRSPLQVAVEAGDMRIVDALLDAGADINSPPSLDGGATALQLAAIQGYTGLANLLIERGALVNAPGAPHRGRTALEGAAEHGRLDMLQLLLSNGAETTGDGQIQYLRSVRFAVTNAYHAAADLLRSHREWTEEDYILLADPRICEG